MSTHELGARAEAAARVHLQRHGLALLQSNYRCRWGEIDLIMQHADAIVFVEVRFRSHDYFGGGLASIDKRKQRKLVRTARHYLQHSANTDCKARIDVVSCAPGTRGELQISWLANAIDVIE
ncbi:MAG: YraN family protein [Gammaproteobacteria bacterium]|nr:YraN family protein [Gammaproteobacteria bacterium]